MRSANDFTCVFFDLVLACWPFLTSASLAATKMATMLPSVSAGAWAVGVAVDSALIELSVDDFFAHEVATSERAARARNVVERKRRKRRNMNPPRAAGGPRRGESPSGGVLWRRAGG